MAERNGRGISRRMLELTCARSNFAVTTPMATLRPQLVHRQKGRLHADGLVGHKPMAVLKAAIADAARCSVLAAASELVGSAKRDAEP